MCGCMYFVCVVVCVAVCVIVCVAVYVFVRLFMCCCAWAGTHGCA